MRATSLRVTRRGVLGALVAVGLSACSTPAKRGLGADAPASPSTTNRPMRRVTLPPAKAYMPLPDEVLPQCKKAAADAISRALTWSSSDGMGITRRLAGLPEGARLAAALRPLVSDDTASVTSVVYPQYGGLDATLTDASVMLVGRQTLLGRDEDGPRSREFIVDVRLSGGGNAWAVNGATIGQAPPAGETDNETRRLLANARVSLPEPARADLMAAIISPDVTALLNTLAQTWRLDVQVLRTGHPRNVFGTDRLSNHTRGRAVDIWAINGTPVIGAPRSLWEPVLKEAARLGATEVGGPGIPERSTRLPAVFFTNPTHRDHLHLGFEPDKKA